jgi:hypothetical protein
MLYGENKRKNFRVFRQQLNTINNESQMENRVKIIFLFNRVLLQFHIKKL